MVDVEKGIIITVIILGLFGMILVGIGFTGKAVMNSYTTGDVCSINKDCENGKICCLFYGQESGVCQTPNMCETVTKITLEERNKLEAWNDFSKETPKDDNTYSLEIAFGILILVIVSVSVYIIHRDKKKKKGIEKKIRRKRKRK